MVSDRLLKICTAHRILLGRGGCGALVGGGREVPMGFGRRKNLEDLGISVRIILKRILKAYEGFDSIILAQDRDKWLVVVNTEMNLRAP